MVTITVRPPKALLMYICKLCVRRKTHSIANIGSVEDQERDTTNRCIAGVGLQPNPKI